MCTIWNGIRLRPPQLLAVVALSIGFVVVVLGLEPVNVASALLDHVGSVAPRTGGLRNATGPGPAQVLHSAACVVRINRKACASRRSNPDGCEFIFRSYAAAVVTAAQVLLSDVIFLSISGEGRRLREGADASVSEVAAAAGIGVPTLLRWETGQLVPAGPQAGDWARVVRVLRHRHQASG